MREMSRLNWNSIDALRNEVDRLRSILAALREPSEAVVEAVEWFAATDEKAATNAIRAAVAAAEREVNGDDQKDTEQEITAMADDAYERAKLRVLAWKALEAEEDA